MEVTNALRPIPGCLAVKQPDDPTKNRYRKFAKALGIELWNGKTELRGATAYMSITKSFLSA